MEESLWVFQVEPFKKFQEPSSTEPPKLPKICLEKSQIEFLEESLEQIK